MRYKTVPGPADAATLDAVHGALPLVPEDVDDCCARVVDRTGVDQREDAREWITFLQALGLAEKTPRGYRRVRQDAGAASAGTEAASVGTEASLGDPFVANVFGAAELLDALEGAESLTVEEAFEHLWPSVPAWERERHADPERVWAERVGRLLEWSVVFGLAVRDGDTYRTSP